jgi:DOPA 4,5-dioxygenase
MPFGRYHAHVYYAPEQRGAAEALRERLLRQADAGGVRYVGRMADRPIGPHPLPQFEVHFPAAALTAIRAIIASTGLRALIHPLTDDDLADHTTNAHWIGEPLALDLAALDSPGENRGLARFGSKDV